MSLDKVIKHCKEHREPYRKSKTIAKVRPMTVYKLQGLRCKIATVDEWLSGDVREVVNGVNEIENIKCVINIRKKRRNDMHYCIIVITKDFPTDKVIEQKLKPYYEYATDDEAAENPPIKYDGWSIGGRYCGLIKLKADRNVKNEYEWGFYAKTPRAGRLYRSMIFEELNNKKPVPWFDEEYYHPYLGYRDGYLLVDGAKISDVINFEELVTDHGYAFIGKDDEIFCRVYYNGKEWVDNLDYENQVREAIKDVQDCYLTVIDIHR